MYLLRDIKWQITEIWRKSGDVGILNRLKISPAFEYGNHE